MRISTKVPNRSLIAPQPLPIPELERPSLYMVPGREELATAQNSLDGLQKDPSRTRKKIAIQTLPPPCQALEAQRQSAEAQLAERDRLAALAAEERQAHTSPVRVTTHHTPHSSPAPHPRPYRFLF